MPRRHPTTLRAFSLCALAAVAVTACSPEPSSEVPPAPPPAAASPAAAERSAVDEAVARFGRRVAERPADGAAWASLGDAFMQKARETHDAGYYARAEDAFTRALARDGGNVPAMVGRAWVHGARHEFEESIEWARKAIALDPGDPAAYGLLGDAAVEMGDYDAAAEHYQHMLDLRPDLSSYSRAAHLLHVTGDVRRAIDLMRKAIDSGAPYAENTAWCRAQLALIYLSIGHVLAAEQELEAGLAAAPGSYHLLAALGRVKAGRGDYAAAIAWYERAAAIAPRHEVVAALGDLYRLTGDQTKAEERYALVEAIHRIHQANGIRGDLELARFLADHDRDLPRALALAEEEYRTRRNVAAADVLAWCYYKNGRIEEARRLVRRALAKNTPDAAIYFHAGMIHARAGERTAAQRYLYKALSLNPHMSPLDAREAAKQLQAMGSRPPDAAPSA
jgi:tetratricopeptide (TPR) repeat protein